MSNFGKIHRRNGSFLADDIRLGRVETIKVVDEKSTINGLEFIVPSDEVGLVIDRGGESRRLGIFM